MASRILTQSHRTITNRTISTTYTTTVRTTSPPLYLILRRSMANASTTPLTSSSSLSLPGPLVSVPWLQQHYDAVKVLDGSWYLPSEKRDPAAEYLVEHLPQARFFDLEACTSKEGNNKDLPHMLPTKVQLTQYLDELDINPRDTVIVYDGKGLFSAPRIRFTLKHFLGMEQVAILEGGLPAWKASGGKLESGKFQRPNKSKDKNASSSSSSLTPTDGLVRTMADVTANINTKQFELVDARSAGRFQGRDPEPRPDIQSGHIPNAKNVPFMNLLKNDEKSGASKCMTDAGTQLCASAA